jgi:two-component system cell cycle sensor histidine kinase/response regulator CckA
MTDKATANSRLLPAARAQTILVIDDDPAMRTILSFTLTAFGYLVLAATNADEALQITRDHSEIRLVVLDVVMPGLSGNKLAEQLKANLPECSILFCSGHPASSMSRYDVDLASAHFVQKPCHPLELERKIEELLGSGAPDSPVPAESP